MEKAIRAMTDAVMGVLGESFLAGYLYGSVALEDFRLGWSDIDVLFISSRELTEGQCAALVHLRQEMLEKHPGNPYFRSFEGAVAALDEFQSGQYCRLVYWGTSGERITDRYHPDPFSLLEIHQNGRLLAGRDVRKELRQPSFSELQAAIQRHCQSIRQNGAATGDSLYSCGWLLDIARCLYTLRTGGIIAKTKAGEWALREGLCPDPADMERTLLVRRDPLQYKNDPDTQIWLRNLNPAVQRFNDVLEKELWKFDSNFRSNLQ